MSCAPMTLCEALNAQPLAWTAQQERVGGWQTRSSLLQVERVAAQHSLRSVTRLVHHRRSARSVLAVIQRSRPLEQQAVSERV